MSMSVEEIFEEARQLPNNQVIELLDRLSEELHLLPTIEGSWAAQTRSRVAEITNGEVRGLPGAEVSARIREIAGR